MDKLRLVLSIALHNFKKWTVNPRMYILLLMLVMYLYSRLSTINDFCAAFDYKIAPHILPFLMDEGNAVMLIMLGAVLLFCDAPFIESEQPYIIMRAGRRAWLCGQFVYILLASALYFLVVALLCMVILLPNLEFTAGWGKVINTFSQTTVAAQHRITIPFARAITNRFVPLEAVVRCFLNSWLVASMLGALMFFVNLNISRTAGAVSGAGLVLWNMVTYKTNPVAVNFSPVSWVSLSRMDYDGSTAYPSNAYIWCLLVGLLLALIFCTWLTMRRRNIDVLKSV